MNKSFINKSITIHTTVPTVWKVLVTKQYIAKWIYEFSEGNLVTEDWHLDSDITMTDDKGTVILEGTITEFNPNQRLKLEFENSDYTEELTLTTKGSFTILSCHAGPVAHTDHKQHAEVWEKGLNKIKELSEAL